MPVAVLSLGLIKNIAWNQAVGVYIADNSINKTIRTYRSATAHINRHSHKYRTLRRRFTDTHKVLTRILYSIHAPGVVRRVECQHGWVYDKQWYETTAVSQEDWVCEKDLYQTNAFAFGRLGEVIGSLVFGQLGDR